MGRSKGATPATGLTLRASALMLIAASVLLATGPSQALTVFAPKAIHVDGTLVLAQAGGLKAGTNLNRTFIRRPSIQSRPRAVQPDVVRRVPLKKDLSGTSKGAPKTAKPRVFGTSGLETGLARDSRALRLRQGLKGTSDDKTGIANTRRLPSVKKDNVRKSRMTTTGRKPDKKKAKADMRKVAPRKPTAAKASGDAVMKGKKIHQNAKPANTTVNSSNRITAVPEKPFTKDAGIANKNVTIIQSTVSNNPANAPAKDTTNRLNKPKVLYYDDTTRARDGVERGKINAGYSESHAVSPDGTEFTIQDTDVSADSAVDKPVRTPPVDLDVAESDLPKRNSE